MLDIISVGSPIDAVRAKWGELPSIREAVLPPLKKVVLPITGVAQRALNTYKTFFPNAKEGVSALGSVFSSLAIVKLTMAIPTCLSDLKNSVERAYRSLSCERIQSALYYGLLEVPKSAAAAVFTFSSLLQKTLPIRFLTNHLAFLPFLGYECLFMIFVLGLLSSSYNSMGKKEFEETLASRPDPKVAPSKHSEEDDSTRSVKRLVKFFGLEEIEADLMTAPTTQEMNALFSEKWEEHQSQKIDRYLAEMIFGNETPEETPEMRALRLEEKKENFIRWTSQECYEAVAEWLSIPKKDATPETLRLRAKLLAGIFQACFKTTVSTHFKNTTSALSTGATFALLFYAKLFLVAAAASSCLLMLAILQIRESQVQEFIVSQFSAE